jgi:methionine--tRNA ligase beta chain
MVEIIKYDDFAKLDLRVGTILGIEEIPGADKLFKLEVDLGNEIGKRTILAGIKQYYSKEELVGKQIIVMVNLEPRKMKGLVSEGMLLAASTEGHEKVILLSPEKSIDAGSKVS